jgi:hypothetical protein
MHNHVISVRNDTGLLMSAATVRVKALRREGSRVGAA